MNLPFLSIGTVSCTTLDPKTFPIKYFSFWIIFRTFVALKEKNTFLRIMIVQFHHI